MLCIRLIIIRFFFKLVVILWYYIYDARGRAHICMFLYILMALHLNVITWYKPFSRIQFSSIPIHVIFHIQNLQEMQITYHIANNISIVHTCRQIYLILLIHCYILISVHFKIYDKNYVCLYIYIYKNIYAYFIYIYIHTRARARAHNTHTHTHIIWRYSKINYDFLLYFITHLFFQ
jgi:hypothetical protein